jgi:hypothetical protein
MPCRFNHFKFGKYKPSRIFLEEVNNLVKSAFFNQFRKRNRLAAVTNGAGNNDK